MTLPDTSRSRSREADWDAVLDDPRWDRIALLGSQPQTRADDFARVDETNYDKAAREPAQGPSLHRLGRPAKHWDPEAALDLWFQAPPGYTRDRRGRWRYEATGSPVPGARDTTLAGLYHFATDGDAVLVPLDLVRTTDELAWCARTKVGERAVLVDGRAQVVCEIPSAQWTARCYAPLGLDAPELAPDRLLDLAGVARLAGVTYPTAASYFSRRERAPVQHRFPEPVARFVGTPVWSAPIVRAWLAARPGQGGGGGRPRLLKSGQKHRANR